MVFCEVNFLLILVFVSSNSHSIFKFSMTTDILQCLLLSQETSLPEPPVLLFYLDCTFCRYVDR